MKAICLVEDEKQGIYIGFLPDGKMNREEFKKFEHIIIPITEDGMETVKEITNWLKEKDCSDKEIIEIFKRFARLITLELIVKDII